MLRVRLLLTLMLVACVARAQSDWRGSPALDQVVEQAVRNNEIPGAVLVVWHDGQILHRKAYGNRALEPRREPMTLDTVFDCASLTKVVATTSSIMLLIEEGKVRLNDRASQYLPGMAANEVTIRQLMTHFSGLRPDLDLKPVWSGYETGVRLALAEKPAIPPGSQFVYSDINFILLGEIVQRASGQTLPEFAARRVFAPLQMTTTMFHPPEALRPKIAPTERVDGVILRGVVHDPTARYMGGAAGHAGLFSTADDLSRFAEMLLAQGQLGGVRIFSPLTVEKMTSPQTAPNQTVLRGLGWDLDSPFSSNRGELLPAGSFGHTGFTGTSMWMDPVTKTFVILLANSVHPTVRPAISSLRSKVATAVAANLPALPGDLVAKRGLRLTGYNEAMVGAKRTVYRNGSVLTGLDVLAREGFRPFQGKRIGLITNQTGVDRERRRNIDLMVQAGVKPVVIFSPEHGISGTADQPDIPDETDAKTGIPIVSLYQENRRRPTAEMLKGLDALVFDAQDGGVRYYTRVTTMAYAMEEAARYRIPFYVLDRPDLINGVSVEGPMLDPERRSFVGYFPLPVRHGMTLGELATLFNAENKIGAELHVIKMQGWERGDWFDETGLPWTNLSPNMRSLSAATLYPGVAQLEGLKNISVGRGTDSPFEFVGADWIDGRALAEDLNARAIPGVRFYAVEREPSSSVFAHQKIAGVQITVTQRDAVDAGELSLEIAAALLKLFPGRIDLEETARLIGDDAAIAALKAGQDPRAIRESWGEKLARFLLTRQKYLLY